MQDSRAHTKKSFSQNHSTATTVYPGGIRELCHSFLLLSLKICTTFWYLTSAQPVGKHFSQPSSKRTACFRQAEVTSARGISLGGNETVPEDFRKLLGKKGTLGVWKACNLGLGGSKPVKHELLLLIQLH